MLSLSATSSHSENEEPLVDHLKAALAVEHVSIASRVSSPLLSDGFVLVFAVVGSAPGAAAPLKKCPAFAHDRGYENIVERCAYAAWNADEGRVVAANELFSVWNGAAVTPQRVLDLYAAKCRVSESNGAPTIGSAPGKAAHSGHLSDDKSGHVHGRRSSRADTCRH
eukprot:TRINITY_DN1147_c0_g1_i1.p1 TRINITY_DN1147_c0_g1~~TRINITY_DN1147_c0_g1_i1.p1  ORF type:complete len:192 (-),score=62.11 TRINITY_DN1147_c0_g1_i1:170-670(-)